jgi:hypothetical protein
VAFQIYVVHALPDSYLSRADGAPYSRADYYADPSAYTSDFHTKVLFRILPRRPRQLIRGRRSRRSCRCS